MKKVHGIVINEKKTDEPVRWFFGLNCLFAWDSVGEQEILTSIIQVQGGTAIEVTEADLPYLKKPEGFLAEYNEFRTPEAGDKVLFTDMTESAATFDWITDPCRDPLSNHRWCKPRKATTADHELVAEKTTWDDLVNVEWYRLNNRWNEICIIAEHHRIMDLIS